MKFGRRNRKTFATVFSTVILAISILSCHCISVGLETCSFQSKGAVNPSKSLVVQYQSLPHEGDLIVDGNETRIIEDCEYNLIGNITVKDNATLIIRNAIFNQTGVGDRVGIMVENRSSFVVTNATLIISQDFSSKILVQDEAIVNIVNSNIINSEQDVLIWPEDSSTFYMENSVMSGLKTCKVVANDNSEVHVENSNFDRATVWGSSTVFIESSSLSDAIRTFNNSTVHVFGSTIGYVHAYGSLLLYIRSSTIESYVQTGIESEVWLIKTSVPEVRAGGSSKVWLISASVGTFQEHDNATVSVGWDIPLFGPIAFHHRLAPVVWLIALIAAGAITFVVLFVVIKKLQKRQKKPKGKA